MNRLPIHPAPGLGDLVSGFYVVPQNPLQLQNEGVSRVPSLGEFMDASFVVPQNPLLAQVTGTVAPIGQGWAGRPMKGKGMGCGCGCGGSGGCGNGMSGLGTLQTDLTQFTSDLTNGNFMTALQDTIGGIPVWGYAAALVALTMMGGKGHR